MPEIAVIELHYLPSLSWMASLRQVDELWLEKWENYQKGSFRNRCHIAGPNGRQRLSIPLEKGKHQKMPIREVRISYRENWIARHIRSLQAGYGNAPFFDFYADGIFQILEKRHSFLFDLNLELLYLLCRHLKWSPDKIGFTASFQTIYPASILDLRNRIHPNHPSSIVNQQSSITYPQVFQEKHGFLPDLSVIDLLFCQGPEASLRLKVKL
jgi:hypothetical protein